MQRVVVSVHDVAPGTLEDVRYLLRRLDAIGVGRRVLKVVPADPADGGLGQHPDLLALLREEVARGNETVVHGFTHLTAAPLRGPWLRRLRARLFAPAAAEFLAVDRDEGLRRLRAGRAVLLAAGLTADGFCAPAWLEPPWMDRACAQAGFRYLVGMASLRQAAGGRRRLTPWVGYMGASTAQERLVGFGNQVCRWAAGRLPLIKVFLHPQGARTSPACERVLAAIPDLCAGRELCTYGELV